MTEITLERILRSDLIPGCLREIYDEAFPVEEQRPWPDICRKTDEGDPFRFIAIKRGKDTVGLITAWDFGKTLYIEHFAIDKDIRGTGIGSKAIKQIVDKAAKTVLLEAEPAKTGEQARRRIQFYQRHGFSPLADYAYIQPPYTPGLPSVELTLMATGKIEEGIHAFVTHTLHPRVYYATPTKR